MSRAAEAANWGREIVPCIINGTAYTASAGAICAECFDRYGRIDYDTLERYGVTSDLWRVCLSFWHHTYPEMCGDWRDIMCEAAQ